MIHLKRKAAVLAAAGAVLLPAALIKVHQSASVSALPLDTGKAIPDPTCGRLDDGKPHLPPDWNTLDPPRSGHSYIDPVFGCKVVRLSDGRGWETTADGKHLSFMNYYSTLSAMNAADSMVMILSDNGEWRIKGVEGDLIVAPTKMPKMNDGHPVWDAFDGNAFYFAAGNSLDKGTVTGNSVKVAPLHTFKEYHGIGSPDAADVSQDGDHIVLAGQNAESTVDVFVWSLSKQVKTSTYTTKCKVNEWGVTQTPQPACVHKVLLTPDNRLLIDFADDGSGAEQGARLWDGSKLIHIQDRTNHLDTGLNLRGSPVFIATNNAVTLSGVRSPCSDQWGLDIRYLDDMGSAICLLDKHPPLHVSYRGSKSQPWAAISFFDDRKAGPELFASNPGFQAPSQNNWQVYEDEIMLARIDGRATYRLAQARSRSAEGYWDQPHAAISRDGKYVVFTSNMAHPNGCPADMHVPNECTDVYVIKVF